MLEQSDEVVHALSFYEEACKYAPESPMVHFKRIRMLVALQRIEVRESNLRYRMLLVGKGRYGPVCVG